MKSVRIGKDITFVWAVQRNGEALTSIENITVFAVHEQGDGYKLPITLKDGSIVAVFYGVSQQKIGKYRLECWYNKGRIEESVVDKIDAVTLVRYSDDDDTDGGADSVTIQLDSSDLSFAVVKGDKGDAATVNGYNAVTITGDVVTVEGENIIIDAYNKTQTDELLATEKSERQSADNTLQGNIDNEASERKSADETLQSNIDSEVTRAKAAEQANADAITNETSARESTDSTLQSNIENEATRAKEAEQAILDDVAATYLTASSVSDTTEYSDVSSLLS